MSNRFGATTVARPRASALRRLACTALGCLAAGCGSSSNPLEEFEPPPAPPPPAAADTVFAFAPPFPVQLPVLFQLMFQDVETGARTVFVCAGDFTLRQSREGEFSGSFVVFDGPRCPRSVSGDVAGRMAPLGRARLDLSEPGGPANQLTAFTGCTYPTGATPFTGGAHAKKMVVRSRALVECPGADGAPRSTEHTMRIDVFRVVPREGVALRRPLPDVGEDQPLGAAHPLSLDDFAQSARGLGPS